MSFCPLGYTTAVRQFDLERGPDLREDPAQIWTASEMLILLHCTTDTCFGGDKEPQRIYQRGRRNFGKHALQCGIRRCSMVQWNQACLAG